MYIRVEDNCGSKSYTQADVTISLNGANSATSAKLTFAKQGGGDVRMYTSTGTSSQTTSFDWTSGTTTCKRYVGANSANGGAGTLVATQLVLKYNNFDFIVDIADITINNPS